jgi:AAA15 family ATPase/GTPase
MMMVYGANASGKSNLINAFLFISSFIPNIPEDKDKETDFIPFRLVDEISESGKFDLLFYVGE